jgi:chorismate mutase
MKELIVLLDLNFTLASNSTNRLEWWTSGKLEEEYRLWLVDWLRSLGVRVFLITARPDRYRDVTLARIEQLTGWQPERAYFKDNDREQAHEYKERVLKTILRPEMPDVTFVGLESNKATRARYQKHDVLSVEIGSHAHLLPDLLAQVYRWCVEHSDRAIALWIARRSQSVAALHARKDQLALPAVDSQQEQHVIERMITAARDHGSLYPDEYAGAVASTLISGVTAVRDRK